MHAYRLQLHFHVLLHVLLDEEVLFIQILDNEGLTLAGLEVELHENGLDRRVAFDQDALEGGRRWLERD